MVTTNLSISESKGHAPPLSLFKLPVALDTPLTIPSWKLPTCLKTPDSLAFLWPLFSNPFPCVFFLDSPFKCYCPSDICHWSSFHFTRPYPLPLSHFRLHADGSQPTYVPAIPFCRLSTKVRIPPLPVLSPPAPCLVSVDLDSSYCLPSIQTDKVLQRAPGFAHFSLMSLLFQST